MSLVNRRHYNMKLSIIVPIYNVERFLPRCLDSLLRQGLKQGEWEVICVNDGSTDNCADILEEYEWKHPGIFKIIAQNNKGVSEARNTGLRVAQGEWIGFVDPDDYLMNGGYKYLFDTYCHDGIDVIAFDKYYVYTDGVERKFADVPLEGQIIFDGDGAEAHNSYELPSVWSKLYRHKFLQQWKMFFEPVYFEDVLFIFQVFSHHPFFIYTNCKIYGYEKNHANSQMHTANKRKVLVQLDGLLWGAEYMNQYLSDGNTALDVAAHRCISIYIDEFFRKTSCIFLTWKEWRVYFRRFKRMPIHQSIKTGGKPKRIARLKNLAAYSYGCYLVISFFYRKYIYKVM